MNPYREITLDRHFDIHSNAILLKIDGSHSWLVIIKARVGASVMIKMKFKGNYRVLPEAKHLEFLREAK